MAAGAVPIRAGAAGDSARCDRDAAGGQPLPRIGHVWDEMGWGETSAVEAHARTRTGFRVPRHKRVYLTDVRHLYLTCRFLFEGSVDGAGAEKRVLYTGILPVNCTSLAYRLCD